VEYANRLTERGHEISLVTPRDTIDPDIDRELNPQVRIYQSKLPRRVSETFHSKISLAWSLSRAVPACDIVFSTHTPAIPSAWLAARIWHKTRLFWLYQDYLEMFEGRKVEQQLLRWGARCHDRIFTVSHWSQQELRAFTSQEPLVVGEGLSHAEYFYPRPVQKTSGAKSILFLGDMRPRKGLFDFLAAVEILYRSYREIQLWIISKDECQIQTRVPFQYIYRPSRSRMAELYASCDLFVSASWWESFGLPPLEAMACGAPVVLTDSRGIREYARSDQNCLLVPPCNPEALAQAMHRVLTDPVLAGRLRQNGPPTATKFTWEAAVNRFEAALV